MKKLGLLVMIIAILLFTSSCSDDVKYTNVNGIKLAYTKQGTGDPLILLHGGGGSHSDFNAAAKQLSGSYTVYAIDSRGNGNSDAVKVYHYQDMADDVVAFIKEKNLKKPALYGFSDGGIVGLLVASENPDLLSALMVSGANANPDGMREEVRSSMESSYSTSGDGQLRMQLHEPDITKDDLAKIKIPTLVMAGSDDMIQEDHTKWITNAIPGSRLNILEGESHTSYVLGSTKVADLIAEFLDQK